MFEGSLPVADPEAEIRWEFRERMERRLAQWYHGRNPHPDPARQARRLFLASLVHKVAMRRYVESMGVALPGLILEAPRLQDVPWTMLPDRIAIKPSNNSYCRGVVLFDGVRDLMSGEAVPRGRLGRHVRQVWDRDDILSKPRTTVVIERMVADCDPAYAVPRDFKMFTAGGRVHLIMVVDRSRGWRGRTASFFTREWEFVRERITTNVEPGPDYPRPPGLEALVAAAETLSADLRAFYRLDFFLSPRGPVLGEFTSYPNAGQGFTPFGDRLMCAIMDHAPDWD
ncbi:ATP-grasp fold amidoligase family protein [Rubellimicrobium sp. CFH 75288]|uniref:ATP-grasp fold amidoligase family protein n=1 Tax=Rubellimicrobium sp. CFH 75288 TaxID=2697034 RepID=UPI0014127900|nr:ATP-grasp fold amidoligase family protein [Rubellimicrobium sp. CFH 75288]NAZ35587.1 hypothetical protein [Rubellimicrobium sp. CFH 75288]